MMKISTQLRKYFLWISLLSVLFITIIANISINLFFSDYLKETRSREDLKVIQYMEQAYFEYEGFSHQFIMSIIHYTMSQGVMIRISDINNQIIWDSEAIDFMHGMMHNGQETYNNNDLMYHQYPLTNNGTKVGLIDIGRPKGIVNSLEDRQFLYTINGVFALAFLFSIIIAVVLSAQISRKFLTPIYKIKENAKRIEWGKYRALEQVKTSTYELHDLSKSIDELAGRLDYQESLRKRMTNDIAHELRTPLSVVQSHIEAFMDGVWRPDMNTLSIIHGEIIRLTKLINELSDLSIVENDEIKINKSNINLSLLVNRVLENFQPMFIEKNIDLYKKIQVNINIMGDGGILNRVLVNILSNAQKYSNNGGEVYVILEQLGDEVQLIIEDTGIGIPEKDLKYIFERFYRSDYSRSRVTGGTGIGLTITKALVEAHGATIGIDSQVGKGTKVTIKFIMK